jgi:hypothetical protein
MGLNKLQSESSQEPETNMWYLENKDETLFISTMKKNNTNIFYKIMDTNYKWTNMIVLK